MPGRPPRYAAQPALELGPFPGGGAIDRVGAEAEPAQHVLVDERDAVLGDGADGQLRLVRRAELADEQHVQRRRERARHLRRDRHAAAGEAEDDDVGAVGVGGEPGGQRAPGLEAIGEAHGRVYGSAGSVRRGGVGAAWRSVRCGHDQHGARRLADHLVGDAAEQEPPHHAMAVRAEHDDVGVVRLGVAHDLVGRRADRDGGGRPSPDRGDG